jgi:hypothetical protein
MKKMVFMAVFTVFMFAAQAQSEATASADKPKKEAKKSCDEGSKEGGCCSKGMVKNVSKSKKAKACCAGGEKEEGKACHEKAEAAEASAKQ